MADRLVFWHRRVPSSRDEQEDAEFLASWSRKVAEELRAARAIETSMLGTAVAAELDVIDLAEGVEASLRLLDEAERLEPPLKICIGAACGAVAASDDGRGGRFRIGAAIDRAQLLANRARAGELVLDPAARTLAETRYLFGRQVGAGAGSLRGHALDRAHPRRADCRPAIENLRAPVLPAEIRDTLHRLDELGRARGQHIVVLRGPIGAGASEWIDAFARHHDPPLVLTLEPVPGVLEPLGSLRYALTRRWKTREGVGPAVAMLGGDAPATLAAIARGAPVDRLAAVAAVRALLSHHGSGGKRPWVVADPLNAVDPATVGVLADALAKDGPDALFIGRLPLDARPPKPLLNRGGLEEIVLPLLRTPDGKEIAQAILGPLTAEDVTRRVAVLGGDTPLGVVEAARTLIAAGDLVWDDGRFRFRVGPRGGVSGIPVESLLDERIASLEPTPRRILEAVCAAPSGSPSELSRVVATADGISPEELAEGIERLVTESLLSPEEPLAATSTMLRAVVVQTMPPSRLGELYRFIAQTMQASAGEDAEFEKATVGFYLAEGGQEAEGARALIEAGRAAALHGFPRAAVRLAAAAVQFDSSPRTRAAATMLSRSVSDATGRDSSPPPPETVVARHGGTEKATGERSVREMAVAALRDRDWEAVDRAIDIAIAEGRDREAAERIRALASLGRSDVAGAFSSLGSASDPYVGARGPRAEIARAVVLLAAERPVEAIRCALRALRATRETGNMQGEAAALCALALAYRAIGRDGAAKKFEDASPA